MSAVDETKPQPPRYLWEAEAAALEADLTLLTRERWPHAETSFGHDGPHEPGDDLNPWPVELYGVFVTLGMDCMEAEGEALYDYLDGLGYGICGPFHDDGRTILDICTLEGPDQRPDAAKPILAALEVTR